MDAMVGWDFEWIEFKWPSFRGLSRLQQLPDTSFCITYLHAVSETTKFPEFFDSEMLDILYFNDAKVYDIWLIANQYF